VFLGCSDHDPHIPLARVRETTGTFTRMGASVTERIYPGSSHGINADELSHLREGLLAMTARHP
jgi:predicted esterase